MADGIDLAVVNRLVELGKLTAGPQMAQGANVPYVMVEGKPQAMPELIFNEYEKELRRVKQTVSVNDPESFNEYYALFKDDNSRTFASEPARTVTAILDYHNAGKPSDPRHGLHQLVLKMIHSEPWNIWFGNNNKKFTQVEFSEFLEQYAVDIADPSPGAMMDVARDLQATTEVEFASAQRSNDGQTKFRYTETTKATVGASQLSVPDHFSIEVPVFIGGAEVRIDALLRFRVNQGKLVIWYTLVRAEEVVRQAFDSARKEISETLSITIINGTVA